MYVCLCNGFTDGCVDRAIDGGASSVAQVYRSLEAIPQCGKCKDTIHSRLKQRGAPAVSEIPPTASADTAAPALVPAE